MGVITDTAQTRLFCKEEEGTKIQKKQIFLGFQKFKKKREREEEEAEKETPVLFV